MLKPLCMLHKIAPDPCKHLYTANFLAADQSEDMLEWHLARLHKTRLRLWPAQLHANVKMEDWIDE